MNIILAQSALIAILFMNIVPISPMTDAPTLFTPLRSYIESIQHDTDKIPTERKEQLKKIALFVQTKLVANEPAQLMFICTHNSRRSHTAQLWAQALAVYYRLEGGIAFSAGTEVTAFNDRAVKALQRAGFTINASQSSKNPVYSVGYANGTKPIEAYSKLITDVANPRSNFCAVMTCSQAEQACPFVSGSSLRVSLPYDDPKDFDGTPNETAKYDERCRQIACEMAYLFAQVRLPR